MDIPISRLIISSLILVQTALPDGYTAEVTWNKKIAVFKNGNRVAMAFATVNDGLVKFIILKNSPGEELQRKLVKKFPNFDPDKLYIL